MREKEQDEMPKDTTCPPQAGAQEAATASQVRIRNVEKRYVELRYGHQLHQNECESASPSSFVSVRVEVLLSTEIFTPCKLLQPQSGFSEFVVSS